jgi:hypothetical protein
MFASKASITATISCSHPASPHRLEVMLCDLIPRRSARVVLCDEEAARQATERRPNSVASDTPTYRCWRGVRVWRDAGYEVLRRQRA